MSLGSQIKALREARGMNVTNFANILGVSPSAVSKWEADKMMPRSHMLVKIAQALGTDKAALLSDKANRSAETSAPTSQIDRTFEQVKPNLASVAVAAQIDQIFKRATAEVLEVMAMAIRRA